MDYWDLFDVALRSVISLLFLFLVTRFMGRKQISQLTFFDYVIGITIGSIAAEMATGLEVPYSHCLLSMGLYGAVDIIISVLTRKSIKMRRLFNGCAYILIKEGKILERNLTKVKYDINELLSAARYAGYFNIADIEYAIMEPDGRISFMPKSEKQIATLEDFHITKENEGLVANVIIDGAIMKENLKMLGLDQKWLRNQIQQQKADKIEEIILATVDKNRNLTIYHKTHELIGHTFID